MKSYFQVGIGYAFWPFKNVEAGSGDPADLLKSNRDLKVTTMQLNLKVARDFIKYSDPGLDEFTHGVVLGLTGNTAFPTPPVKPTDLDALDLAFRAAIAAATGDPADTAAKNDAREAVLDALRKNANYVQTIASHNMQMLLSSGFYAASTNHSQSPLDAPVITELDNLATSQVLLRLTPLTNAKAYHVQTSVDGGKTWQDGGIYTQARRIVLTGLTSGTTYNVRARAIGGSTGCSDWSKPMPIMAT